MVGGIEAWRKHSSTCIGGAMASACLMRRADGSREGGWDWVSRTRWYYCSSHPTFSAPHSFALALALLRDAPAAASNSQPDSRNTEQPDSLHQDRAFFQPALSVLGPSSTRPPRPSKRTVCCSCISRNQIMKMLRLAQYLGHGCLHFEETQKFVY